MATYLWKQCWHWWPPTCIGRFWRLARTAWIAERAYRKYSRIFDDATQGRGYVFSAEEWWWDSTINGTEVDATRACPREGWLETYVRDANGQVVVKDDDLLTVRLHGDVGVVNARRHGGFSLVDAADG